MFDCYAAIDVHTATICVHADIVASCTLCFTMMLAIVSIYCVDGIWHLS